MLVLAVWRSRLLAGGAISALFAVLVGSVPAVATPQAPVADSAPLAVSVDDDTVAAARYAIAHPVSFPVLLDPDKEIARTYRVDNLPMLLLIDRSGAIRHVHRDYRSGDEKAFLERIKPLLDE